jgi:hypothetical protein
MRLPFIFPPILFPISYPPTRVITKDFILFIIAGAQGLPISALASSLQSSGRVASSGTTSYWQVPISGDISVIGSCRSNAELVCTSSFYWYVQEIEFKIPMRPGIPPRLAACPASRNPGFIYYPELHLRKPSHHSAQLGSIT